MRWNHSVERRRQSTLPEEGIGCGKRLGGKRPGFFVLKNAMAICFYGVDRNDPTLLAQGIPFPEFGGSFFDF